MVEGGLGCSSSSVVELFVAQPVRAASETKFVPVPMDEQAPRETLLRDLAKIAKLNAIAGKTTTIDL